MTLIDINLDLTDDYEPPQEYLTITFNEPESRAAPGAIGGGFGAPAHLSVTGHELCLGSQEAEDGSFSVMCIPAEKPADCFQESWDKLMDVFGGDQCTGEYYTQMGYL